MADPSLAPRRSGQGEAAALFSVVWALAALWHLLGNTTQAPGWSQGLLVLGAGLVLLRPGEPVPLAVLAVGGLVTVWGEAPVVGNHWVLAGFVDLAILMAVGTALLRGRVHDRADLVNRLFPVARLCLLGFYAFAAFAKLNSAFFDRSVSCAVYYFRESTDSVGLSGLQLGGAAGVEWAVIVGTAAVELSVPVLLLWPRTRRIGVMVGLVFHAILAVDHRHEFFDFSSVLLPLFLLFLPGTAGAWVAERVGSVRARLALQHPDLPGRVHLALVAAVTVPGVLVAAGALSISQARSIGWWPWQLFALVVILATIRFLWQERRQESGPLLPHHALFAIVPLLVVVNGLTPYLELKTGYGWNMYANLRTVDGETNHLVVPGTLPLTDEQADVVRILSTDSPVLERYRKMGYGFTWRQLRSYLSEHPDVRLTYQRGGRTVSLERAADDPDLVAPVPTWQEKLLLFRAVDLEEPERCVPVFGPAR